MDRQKWEQVYIRLRRNVKQRRQRINMFALDTRARILEMGCGDGLNLKAFQELGYSDIWGLDNSPELLSRIQDKRTILADACNTGLQSGSFDAVFSDSFLHHISDLEAVFEEIRRLLRPGGFFCFMEPRSSFVRRAFDAVTFSPLADISEFLKNRKISLKEEYSLYKHWLDNGRKLPEFLAKFGFKVIFWRNNSIGMFVKCSIINYT